MPSSNRSLKRLRVFCFQETLKIGGTLHHGKRNTHGYGILRQWMLPTAQCVFASPPKYSASVDAVYCSVCVCFAPKGQSNPEFVTRPFSDWKNARGQERGALLRHENSEKHQAAMRMSEEFLMVHMCRGQKKPISEFISQAYAEKVDRNRKFLLCILDVILSLGKRGFTSEGVGGKKQRKKTVTLHSLSNGKPRTIQNC